MAADTTPTKTSFDIAACYTECYNEEQSAALATLRTLIRFLDQDTSSTVTGLSKNIRSAINTLKAVDVRTEVESVAEIYFRFITLSAEKFAVSFLGRILEIPDPNLI